MHGVISHPNAMSYGNLLCNLLHWLDLEQFNLCISVAETFEPQHEISNNLVFATSKGSDQPAHMRSLIRALICLLLEYSITIRLLT